MTDEPRQREVRVNTADLTMLKSAQNQFETGVPLGYVARVGARKILEDTEDNEVTIA